MAGLINDKPENYTGVFVMCSGGEGWLAVVVNYLSVECQVLIKVKLNCRMCHAINFYISQLESFCSQDYYFALCEFYGECHRTLL